MTTEQLALVNAALGAALVTVTTYYAVTTHRILRANDRVVGVMRDQAEDMTRPYVTVSVFGRFILYLRIANTGRTAAYSLRLALDRDFYKYGRANPEDNLATLNAFQQQIECFPPGAELVFALAQAPVLFGPAANPTRTPLLFNVTATYSYSGRTRREATAIDLRPYFLSHEPPDPTLEELEKIRKEIEKIRSALERPHAKG